MIMDGCQGKPRTPTIHEMVCPECGNIIEMFSTDTEVACEHCGFLRITIHLAACSGANMQKNA